MARLNMELNQPDRQALLYIGAYLGYEINNNKAEQEETKKVIVNV